MNSRSGGLLSFVIFTAVIGGFIFMLLSNAEQGEPIRAIVPTQVETQAPENSWEIVLQSGFGGDSTTVPTIPIPDQRFVAPTLPPANTEQTTDSVSASDISGEARATQQSDNLGATPTPLPPSPTIGAEVTAADQLTEVFAPRPTGTPQPPALAVPLNRDPLGRDHYIFQRPIDSFGVNFGLQSYLYGSDGPASDSISRIHHGIDMPNPEGTIIRAAGSGVIIFASTEDQPYLQNSASYGNVVVIEHDFGWTNGEPIFTLYAHLLRPLVQAGDRVNAGDPIALNGNTGLSTGAHLHFEVRIGENRYGSTVNPVLWMAPYVGHGTIAGTLTDRRGNFLMDETITIRNWANGRIERTTTTYIFDGTVNQVNSDPIWGENFVVGDLRTGRYEVIATIDGQRVSQIVDVYEGRTAFVELSQPEITLEQSQEQNSGG